MTGVSNEEFQALREDVAYIRGKIDSLPEYEKLDGRVRDLEKWKWGLPASLIAALLALFGHSAS